LAGTVEVPEVKWDSAAVSENVDFWLGSRGLLRDRILPMGERDVELAKRKLDPEKSAWKSMNRLEEMVVGEMAGIRAVLSGGEP